MTVKVKICGLTRIKDIQACARLGAHWVGFVFHPASPRFVSFEQAAHLHQSIPLPSEEGPLRVGLFVKPSHEQISAALEHLPLDVLQLYTDENTALELKAKTGKAVWLARGITSKADLPESDRLDGYIIEAPAGKDDTRPGGLGRSFDWSLTYGWTSPAPWLLAGGLRPENVAKAVQTSGCKAVDVSSGVEERPGIKSALLIEKFIENSQKGSCAHRE